MTILNSNQIIRGIKSKTPPTFNDGHFDKTKPLGEHNFPLTKYTTWRIYGYKKDIAGFKTPHWLIKKLPTGKALTPQMVGLDGFFHAYPINQVI